MGNKKIKILIVAMKYFPASGGSASYSYNMAIGLHRLGYEILLLAPSHKKRKIDDSNSPFKIKRLPYTPKILGIDISRVIDPVLILIEYLRFKPDVIWATSFASCKTLGTLAFLKTKFIATIHGGGIHRRYPSKALNNKITDWLGLRFMKQSVAIVTVSENSKQIIINKLPYGDIIKKIKIIYNSLEFDESKFYTQKQALAELPALKNKKIILTVGRLIPAKGHDIVIKSVKLLIKKFPDIIYVIVGEGNEKESLKNLVKDEKLENNIIFTGYVTDKELEMYYAACDLFVMAGRWTSYFVEGFGLVYIEAGVRGKPVIGTNIGGIPEAIVEGKTGFIVEPENPRAIAGKIEYLLKNEKVRKQMGKFASKYIKEHYSNEIMAGFNSELIKNIFK